MSGPLKEAAPLGSLAARVLEEKPIPVSTRRQLVSVSQGWRSEGFRSASEKLSAASSRLQTEAEHESQFWEQVAKCRAKGWPVSRLPRDRKAIGVHFGFPEAAPQFRDRGFALLRQAADGSVGLDARSLPRKRKHVAVYVVRDNVKTGAFRFETPISDESADITQQLTEHRDTLFEEELFFEISREARLVANQSVRTRGQTVEVDVNDYQLLLVSSDELELSLSTIDEDNSIAGFVAISLRLLLNAAHERNLSRRSRKPPPMTTKARTTPEYALIRPILTHLRHRAESRAFWNDSKALLRPLARAGLPIKMSVENSSLKVFDSLEIEPPDTILSQFMVPAKTAFDLRLAGGQSMQIGLATFLGPPLLGSRYETSPIDFRFAKLPFSRHETRDVVVAFIRHILVLDLVAQVETLTQQSMADVTVDKSKRKDWRSSEPHSGELTMFDSNEAVHKMQLSVQPESVSVKLSPVKKKSASGSVLRTWTVDGCLKAEGNLITKDKDITFDEAVKESVARDS